MNIKLTRMSYKIYEKHQSIKALSSLCRKKFLYELLNLLGRRWSYPSI